MSQYARNCSIYLTCYCHVGARNRNASQMSYICYICKLVCVHMKQLCQCKYLIRTHYNQQCDKEHWYAYISHYWHITENKYVCHIAHNLLFFYCSLQTDFTHELETTAIAIYVPATNMSPTAIYMPQALVHQWVMFANIYAAYVLTGINHMIRGTVQKRQ